MSELWSNLFRPSPKNIDELLQHDHHECVPKAGPVMEVCSASSVKKEHTSFQQWFSGDLQVIAIAAAHVRLWRDLANGNLPTRPIAGELEGRPAQQQL